MSAGAPRAFRTPFSWLPWLALVLLAGLSWLVLVAGARSMSSTGTSGMPMMGGGGPVSVWMHHAMRPEAFLPYFAATSLMWIVMMVAMMVPAVAPMARAVERAQEHEGRSHPGAFAAGYLGAWSGFGVGAALLQWGLHRVGWLHGPSLAAGPALGGAILVLAGAYQLTPLKDVCLTHCRSPIRFLLEHWKPGRGGALQMGFHHGLYCIGCCWLLMLLMFAGGAMSVLCMAALCILIVAERVLPHGPWVSRIPGLLLIAAGVAVWLRGSA